MTVAWATLGLAGLVAGWVAVLVVVARLTGWARLAARYPCQRAFLGRRWPGQTVWLRRPTVRYCNVITLGADRMGLYLAPMSLFRPGHAAVCVPWAEVAVGADERGRPDLVTLEFRGLPDVPVLIEATLARELAEEARGSWPGGGEGAS